MNLKILESLSAGKTGRELDEIRLIESVNQKFALKVHFDMPLVFKEKIQIRFNGKPLADYQMSGRKVSVQHYLKKGGVVYNYTLANISRLLCSGKLEDKNSLTVRAVDNFGMVHFGQIFFCKKRKGYDILKATA